MNQQTVCAEFELLLEQILKTLNSNCETPYLLWDNGTRAELCEFLDQQCHEGTGSSDPSCGIEFVYTAHRKELVVGEIFVRIYNQQPTYTIEVSVYVDRTNSMCSFSY
jgi:DnaJ family protein C protein 13